MKTFFSPSFSIAIGRYQNVCFKYHLIYPATAAPASITERKHFFGNHAKSLAIEKCVCVRNTIGQQKWHNNVPISIKKHYRLIIKSFMAWIEILLKWFWASENVFLSQEFDDERRTKKRNPIIWVFDIGDGEIIIIDSIKKPNKSVILQAFHKLDSSRESSRVDTIHLYNSCECVCSLLWYNKTSKTMRHSHHSQQYTHTAKALPISGWLTSYLRGYMSVVKWFKRMNVSDLLLSHNNFTYTHTRKSHRRRRHYMHMYLCWC